MPVRIRLSRGGAKKRPFYRIVVADSRRARDGKFIDQVGTYNPMLPKDSPERVKINVEKTKDWISKGAQPSERVTLFLSKLGVVEKPVITEKTKKHLPRKKTQERLAAAKEKGEAPEKAELKDNIAKPDEATKTEAPAVKSAPNKKKIAGSDKVDEKAKKIVEKVVNKTSAKKENKKAK